MAISLHFAQLIEKPCEHGLVLNPAASQAEICDAQDAMGISFPESLIELYQCANGEGMSTDSNHRVPFGLFGGFPFSSLDTVVKKHQEYAKYLQKIDRFAAHLTRQPRYHSRPDKAIKGAFFNTNWIPFSADRENPTYLAMDMEPGIEGVNNQIIMFGPDASPNVFQVSENLEKFLFTLQQQYSVGNGHPIFGDEYDNLSKHIKDKYGMH